MGGASASGHSAAVGPAPVPVDVGRAVRLVAVDRRGNLYRFDERSTGQFRNEIDQRLSGLDAAELPSVTEAKDAQRDAGRAA
jgi:hypothetical protein